jgi:hypothetical protein
VYMCVCVCVCMYIMYMSLSLHRHRFWKKDELLPQLKHLDYGFLPFISSLWLTLSRNVFSPC